MGTVIGSRKQEDKISELGAVAHRRFPHIDLLSFKGFFRLSVRSVLEKYKLSSWGDVAEKPPEIRRKFFHDVLDESLRHLETAGLAKEDAGQLISELKKENEKYLKF